MELQTFQTQAQRRILENGLAFQRRSDIVEGLQTGHLHFECKKFLHLLYGQTSFASLDAGSSYKSMENWYFFKLYAQSLMCLVLADFSSTARVLWLEGACRQTEAKIQVQQPLRQRQEVLARAVLPPPYPLRQGPTWSQNKCYYLGSYCLEATHQKEHLEICSADLGLTTDQFIIHTHTYI